MTTRSEDILGPLYENRLLVLMECEGECVNNDESHHFHQVLLTKEQFKKVSDAVIVNEQPDASLKEGYNLATLSLGTTSVPAAPFEGMGSIDAI